MTAEAILAAEHPEPPVEVPAVGLSRALTTRSAAIAHAWRRAWQGDRPDPMLALGQLDGLVEGLVYELGRSLGELSDLPAAPWGRVSGVLRLSITRGADSLGQEFAVLRGLLEQVARQVGAGEPERKRLRILLDASQAQALALLRQRANPACTRAAVAFGGVVVEVT